MARPRLPRCLIEGCDDIATHKGSQLCHRCHNRLAYQLKKGVTWMLKRAKRLDSWQGGLAHLLGTKKVTRIPKRQSRVRVRRAA